MKLASRTFGDQGEPLLVLHGLLGQADNWTAVARSLADECRAHCLDQRNHGDSPHTEQMSYADMASDVCEYMDDRKLDAVTLIGHSMGGKTAMQVAADCPCRVARLIVVDISPRAYPIRHRKAIDAMLAVDPAGYATRREVDAALAGRIPMPVLRRFLLKNLRTRADGALEWTLNLPAIARAYDEIMGAVPGDLAFDGPALFIRGGKSDYLADSDRPLLKKHYPHAEFSTIPGASHWVHADAPAAFLQAVRAFAGLTPQP